MTGTLVRALTGSMDLYELPTAWATTSLVVRVVFFVNKNARQIGGRTDAETFIGERIEE